MDKSKIGYIICESGIVVDAPEPKIIQEDTIDFPDDRGNLQKQRRVIADTVLQTANIFNRNTRMYPKEELFPQITSPRTTELMKHGQFCGEAGHPLEATLVRQQTIDPKLIMSRYIKLWTDGDFIWGRYKGTNNEYGQMLDMDLREGYFPEFSLRALGTVESTPKGAIVRNLKMITYDVVIYQSDPNAYTRGIVNEAANAGNNMLIEDRSNILEPITSADVVNYIMQESTNLKAIRESFDINHDSIKYLPDIDKVRMLDSNGDVIMMNLESYISNELINYAMNR